MRHGWEVYVPGGELVGTATRLRAALKLVEMVAPTTDEIIMALWSEGRLVELLWWRLR